MLKIYSEEEISWSSIEKYIPYSKVVWSMNNNGMPKYVFFGEDGKKVAINDYRE